MEFQGRPEFAKYHQSYHYDDYYLTWYLDVAPNSNKVLSLNFESNLEFRHLAMMSELCGWVQGRELGQIPRGDELSTQALWPVALMSYRLFIREIIGGDIAFHQQKNEGEDDLLCRCFGVYSQEIIAHLVRETQLEHTLQSLGTHLQAGIGCGSCHHDLVALLATFGHDDQSSLKQQQEQAAKRWEKMESQELASSCHEVAKELVADQSAIEKLSVFGVKPGHVLFQYKGQLEQEVVLEHLQAQIDQRLGPGLTITLR